MKGSKFIKAVAAITMSAVSAAACFGSVGCAHKHSWGEYTSDGEGGHYRVCSGCDARESVSPHEYGGDNECDLCHYVKNSGSGEENQSKIIEPTLTEADDDVPETDEDGNIISVNEFNPSDLGSQTLSADYSSGIFKISSGTIIEGKNVASITDYDTKQVVAEPGTDGEGALTHIVKLNSDTAAITVTTKGAGTLKIWASCGSSSATSAAIKINGTSYSYGTSGGWQINYEITNSGTFKIERNKSVNGTSNIHYISFTSKVEDTEVDHIDFVDGTVDYYVGQQFDGSGVTANAIYKDTGRIEAIKNGRLKIDYTAFDSTKAGNYDIKVYYTKHEVEHEMTYKVNVYDFESITFDTKYTVKEAKNTAAGNGVYATHWLKDLYVKGATVNDDGLVVILNGKLDSKTKSFTLKAGQYTLSGADTSTTGKKTVTVNVTANGITKTNTFDIYVIESVASEVASLSEVKTRVNGNCTDEQIGVKNAADEYQFKTVRQALEFYEDLNLGAAVKKTINLEAGNYWEKLEVKIPNVSIIGAGVNTTKIEYDELWGVEDATGFAQTTDSTATMNVRDSAYGFTIKGVTVSNYYNSTDKYPAGADGRALALLVQADKFIAQDCAFLGWQDTIELFTGRQYFVNSTIKGTTDFIFGTNNTTYFYQCNIVTVPNGSKGGYITAMKGQNKGSSDKVTYGVIFDDCDFTYEGNVPNGDKADTAIGRTWGADAAVMIMNSRLGSHITKTEGKRYTSMNNNSPAKAQFLEYNNTGAGAVTATASNKYWTVPSATDAAKYNNLDLIFSKTANANLNSYYADKGDWDVLKTVTVHYGESTVAVKVPYGGKITLSALTADVTAPGGKGIEGVYADGNKTPLDLSAGITEDKDVYVEFEDLVDVDLNLGTLLSGGNIKYTPNGGAETTITTVVGTGAAYGAGTIELGNGVSATFDGNCVKVNNVKPNATSTDWTLDWSGVDGGATQYETYITLGGPSTADRYLAVNVKAGCTIKVYCAATADGRTATVGTAAETPAANATANGSTVLGAVTSTADGTGFVLEATVSSAGTYYINCSNAISFFRIVVDY